MPKSLKTVSLILLWIFIIVAFGIIATSLVFMALGYKYNFKSGQVQKTGMVYLKALPKTADVYIDGELRSLKTPVRIPYLVERDYRLKVSEENYLVWEKTVSIKAEEVASFDRIVLFLKDRKTEKLQAGTSDILSSPNHSRIAYLSANKKELKVYSVSTEKSLSLYKAKNPLSLVSWSENSGRILFKENKKGYLAVSATNPNSFFNIAQQFDYTFTHLEWNPDNYNYMFALSNKNTLYRLDLVNNRIRALKSRVAMFDASKDEIFYLYKKDSDPKLLKTNFQGNGQTLLEKITGDLAQISISESGRIALRYTSGKLVYLIRENGAYEEEVLAENALGQIWTNPISFLDNILGKDKLLYFSENEIGGYYKKRDPRYTEEENHLITRVGRKIDKIEWYYDLEHVVYLSEGRVRICELDGGNDTILAEDVLDFALDSNGKTLYLLNDYGLNKMVIRK